MLNVIRPAILRQYHILDLDEFPNNGTDKGHTYGFCSAKQVYVASHITI